MKSILTGIALLSIHSIAFGQTPVTIADKDTRQAIPFANVQVKDSNEGASANEQGSFLYTDKMKSETLTISAIGYYIKEVKTIVSDTLFLEASFIEVPTVEIAASKTPLQTKVGSYKKNNKAMGFGAGNMQPWILARYFPYDAQYHKTPYVKTITLETRSSIKNAQFVIRLYKKGANGEPGDFLYNKPILAFAKKGTNNTVIDLSEYNIVFPEEGLFVAMEYLTIESNKCTYTEIDEGSKKGYKNFSYEPEFLSLPCEVDDMSMIYHRGKWNKMLLNKSAFKAQDYVGKYNMFAMELTLTN